MELKIFNKDLNLIGIIDSYSYLMWTRKYNDLGAFQLNILFTSDNNSLLETGNIIYKDSGECGYITSKEIRIEADGTEIIEVKGEFILGYLARRIIWGYEDINMNIADAVNKFIDSNCINTTTERKIPNFELGTKLNTSIKINRQLSHENLLETLINIAQDHELGLKVDFDIKAKKLIFKLYEGINRSINQNSISPVVFSRDFENVLDQNFIESKNTYKNVALVAGAGEGTKRKTATVGSASGLDRYEIFVDARDVSDVRTTESGGSTTDIPIPDIEYLPLLQARGKDKLTEHFEIKSFNGTINHNSNYKYKIDFDLGDVVTFHEKKWGITINSRITEISEVYDTNGMTLQLTFGNDVPTLIQMIKGR